jgi:putative transposase
VYIEALHSNVQREVVERYEFESIYHVQMVFSRCYELYNNYRKHGSLGRKLPEQFLLQYAQQINLVKQKKLPEIVSNLNHVLSKN